MLFDTHTHYDDEAYDADRDELLQSLEKNGIRAVCNVGANLKGCRDSIALAQKYPFVYAAVGVHPDECKELGGYEQHGCCDFVEFDSGEFDSGECVSDSDITDKSVRTLKDLASHGKVVAIGEIGLDYHGFDRYPGKPSKELQKYWFSKQLGIARDMNLPVIIHSRNASDDTLEFMTKAWDKGNGITNAIIHCFSYSKETAMRYLDMGFYLGFGGSCTYEGQKKLSKILKSVPPERVVLETDCPYLTPGCLRGQRNSSLYLPMIRDKVAQLMGINPAELERISWNNARRVYRLDSLPEN